jgi:hypothetical protein
MRCFPDDSESDHMLQSLYYGFTLYCYGTQAEEPQEQLLELYLHSPETEYEYGSEENVRCKRDVMSWTDIMIFVMQTRAKESVPQVPTFHRVSDCGWVWKGVLILIPFRSSLFLSNDVFVKDSWM